MSNYCIPQRDTFGVHYYSRDGDMINCHIITRSSQVAEVLSIDIKPMFQIQLDCEQDAITVLDDLGKSDPEYRR